MFIRLLLMFSLIPLVELALLIKIGGYMGVLPTIILVAGTGIVGISLARYHGFQLFSEVKQTLQNGQIPADHLIEGLLILIGAVMLLTPGLLTDISGFLLIIPTSRHFVARLVKKKFQSWINKSRFHVSYNEYQRPTSEKSVHGNPQNQEGSIDVNFKDLQDENDV